MSLFGVKFSLNEAAQFLGWSGSLTSFLFILAGIDVIYHNLAGSQCQDGALSLCGIPFALILILGNVGMFVFSSRLAGKARQDDVVGVKAQIKTGCYIVAQLEAAVCLAGLAPLTSVLSVSEGLLTVLQWASPLLYILMLCIGLAKSQPRLIRAYIIFKIVHFLLLVLAWLVVYTILLALSLKYPVGLLLLTDVLLLIVIGFLYVFSTGFSVVHYNVLVNNAVTASPAEVKI